MKTDINELKNRHESNELQNQVKRFRPQVKEMVLIYPDLHNRNLFMLVYLNFLNVTI